MEKEVNSVNVRTTLSAIIFLVFSMSNTTQSSAEVIFNSCKQGESTSSISISTVENFSANDVRNLGQTLLEHCGDTGDTIGIRIKGEIGKGLVGALKGIEHFFQRLPSLSSSGSFRGTWGIWLNSSGGLVYPAIEAGTYIANIAIEKRLMILAFVKEGDQCLSACAIFLAAAPSRAIMGKVGLHRPSKKEIDASALSYEGLRSSYKKVFDDIENYIDLFGVSPEFVSLMKSTPSNQMNILSEQDLDRIGLSGQNASYAEIFRERMRSRVLKNCGKSYLKGFDVHMQLHTSKCVDPSYTGNELLSAWDKCKKENAGFMLRKHNWKLDKSCFE
jgi:hypothetical protein